MVTNLDKKMLTGFSREVRSYLPSIREGINGFCDNAVRCDSLEEALRFIHTIKGASGLMGLSALSQLTAYIEETLEEIISGHAPMDTNQGFRLCQTIDRIEPYLDGLLDGESNDQALLADLEQSGTRLPWDSVNKEVDGVIESNFADESTVSGITATLSEYRFEDSEDPALLADWPGEISSEMRALDLVSEGAAEGTHSQLQSESASLVDTDEGVSAGRLEAPLGEVNGDEDDLNNLPEDRWVGDTIAVGEGELAESVSSFVTPDENLSQDDLCISDECVSAIETDKLYDSQASDDQQERQDDRFEVPYGDRSDLVPDIDDELAFADDEAREPQSVSDRQSTSLLFQEQEQVEEVQEYQSEIIANDVDATDTYDVPDIEDIRDNQEQYISRNYRFEKIAQLNAISGDLDNLIHSIDQEVRQIYHHDTLSFDSSCSPLNYTNTRERFVVFIISGSCYAVPVASILEIGRVPSITMIPNVPLWMSGVINLRGEIISVIDLRTFLGIEDTYQLDNSRILVVKTQNEEITTSIVVDQVRGFVGLDTDQMAAATLPLDDWVAPYLKGVFEYEDQVLAVMDLDRFLLSPEIHQFKSGLLD